MFVLNSLSTQMSSTNMQYVQLGFRKYLQNLEIPKKSFYQQGKLINSLFHLLPYSSEDPC